LSVPEFVILPRSKAEAYQPSGVEVCISITNPGEHEAALSSAFKSILRLSFSDLREPSTDPRRVLFSSDHAREIVRFVKSCSDVDRILVHCSLPLGRVRELRAFALAHVYFRLL
jgi:predicted protein tyrosine phosphatase